ncbi:MOG interacting and ectopic P-granules protein 1 isoform X2 [Lepeophtheirus salmonis]|uniref:MOG interacting and ectopic P-granules protein 1 n=2 Tax=Lepeophtheirus salmonis TaxID=72036 RepID=A0A0K2U5W6_LEPSM
MSGSEEEEKREELLFEKNGSGGDEDMEALEEEEEEEERDFELEGENGGKCENGAEKDSLGRVNGRRRKSPLGVRREVLLDEGEEEEEEVEMDEDDLNDVEEIKDDSDIMEVEEEEDPLGLGSDKKTTPLMMKKPSGTSPLASGPKKVVTIDDVKVLHKIAASNRKESAAAAAKNNVVLIDTDSILAGKSGVTITPASRPKTNSLPNLPAGVTISHAPKVGHNASSSSSITKKPELNDPNLTDDTFVVEAPSFIVPYVYEKPPKETFSAFWEDIKKLQDKIRDEKRKKKEQEAEKLRKRKEEGEEEDPEFDPDAVIVEDEKAKLSSESSSEEEDEILQPSKKAQSENYFESPLGKFFMDLGMNLVQEAVQTDLLKQQIRKSQRDKSATVMHAIMSLKKNLEASKENNRDFHLDMKKCKICSYKTESQLVMASHLEMPHIRMTFYRCNFCPYETKLPQEVLFHMMAQHGIRSKLERSPFLHQCPQCPFEDNMKGKLTRHKTACDKRFRPEKNLEPAFDWEPPAKIPKPPVSRTSGRVYSSFSGGPIPGSLLSSTTNVRSNINKGFYSGMPQLQLGGSSISMARSGSGRSGFTGMQSGGRQMVGGQFMNNQVVLQALNQGGRSVSSNSSVLLPGNLANSGSVTIQSVNQRNSRGPNSPSISITPLPGRSSSGNSVRPSPSVMRPGQPNAGQGKGNLVICEICDGFIKDLEQLRNHMQWIHKVKIHPKMIYNRPPLNCQKCQYRFFTDQGLERHLLGSHGLVTASMQELANKGQDSGRCPVCGKVYQWKLLNHVAKDHQKSLKPAHLSYKCTVCTATFGQYKLFENHVYTAHSGAAKKSDKSKVGSKPAASSSPNILKPPQLSDEITIIPQKKSNITSSNTYESKNNPKV